MVLVDYSITDTYTQVSEPQPPLAAGSHPQGLDRVAITGPHCPSSQSGLEPSFPSGVATCWCHTRVGGRGFRSSRVVQLWRPAGGLGLCATLSQESWRNRCGTGGRMTGAPRAGLLTASLGLREKVDHFLIHCQNLGGTMTLEDYRTNFPQSCSHPNSLELWCRGHRAGWEQLLRGVAGVPEPSLPSGHAEADGAHGALGDLPQQAHVVHPAPGQCASFPALDDGGGRCARTPGPHPDLHGDTDHCVRGRGGPRAEEVGEEWGRGTGSLLGGAVPGPGAWCPHGALRGYLSVATTTCRVALDGPQNVLAARSLSQGSSHVSHFG